MIQINLFTEQKRVCVYIYAKEPACQQRDIRHSFNPWAGKNSRRRARQPTPVFLPGESHAQRSLEGHGP